ncbi:amidase family protein [Lichenibacterium dinghuense]|uniref:amidase family protein n=1 Tax=Lichenibacterium dinghuense TaxID=2895977 RepID=UPI001EEF34B8|nr:amidase family protein [Lichenibacterium sp. 6Y81]
MALGLAEASKIFTRFDADRAYAVARALERRRRAGEPLPLYGLRVSIKDLFDEAGTVTTAGSVLLRERAPAAEDAPAVARLLAAGAVPFGRTTMSEFAYSGVGLNPHHGTPGNARDASRIPGGSSSGGGVSVALGLCDAALGSDTGGSIRIPAALNGLAGWKPSQKAVPLAGGFPLSGSYDSFGPIAPTLAICAAVHAVLSGEARPEGRRRGVAGLKVGAVSTVLADGLDDVVGDAYARALAELSRAGAAVRDVAVPCFAEASEVNAAIVAAEAHAIHAAHVDRLEAVGDPRVLRRIRAGAGVTPETLSEARRRRAEARAAYGALAGEFDVLVGPTVPVVAPTIAAVERDFDRLNALVLRNPSRVNFVDGCAATVPMTGPEGLAAGLMVMGRGGDDWAVLDAAEAIEGVLGRANGR